jgi:hypothetical protein
MLGRPPEVCSLLAVPIRRHVRLLALLNVLEVAWAAGRAMTPDQAAAYAMHENGSA